MLGQLNSLIYKCYEIREGDIFPALGESEQAIYALLYISDFYKKQVSQYLGAAGVKRVISVREGDSSVQLVNSNEQAKTIRGLAQDYTNQAKEMADLYNRGLATARGVSLYTIDQYRNTNGLGDDFGSPNFFR
jgi:hypothetical protein